MTSTVAALLLASALVTAPDVPADLEVAPDATVLADATPIHANELAELDPMMAAILLSCAGFVGVVGGDLFSDRGAGEAGVSFEPPEQGMGVMVEVDGHF